MRITTVLILIFVVALMFAGQTVYQSDLENNEIRDIYNFTETSLPWDSSVGENIKSSIQPDIKVKEYNVNVQRFGNILGEFINFAGYSLMELSKWSIEYGYGHPEHDLGFFLDFLIKILWLIIIIILIPLIVPLLAIIYLSFKGIYLLTIKVIEWFKKNDKRKTKV